VPNATEVMSPDAQRHRQYDRSYQLYRQLYPALADVMRFAAVDQT
jgi:sugar (pentulose or hexulose) kinase